LTEENVRLKPDATPDAPEGGLQPWMFFVLAGLGCATVATFMARGQSIAAIVLVSVLMAATTVVGLAVLRTVRPLVFGDEDRTQMIGQRTRVALEREKLLVLRSIKELEFDKAMGKLSAGDFDEMSGRLRVRAARLIRQLDAGGGYRAQIEADLRKRLAGQDGRDGQDRQDGQETVRFCSQCGTARDADAKFCKNCGAKL
jgi:hypothetical protein